MAPLMGSTALELIGQGGLGYSFEELDGNGRNKLATSLKQLLCALVLLLVVDLLRRHCHFPARTPRSWGP